MPGSQKEEEEEENDDTDIDMDGADGCERDVVNVLVLFGAVGLIA